MSMVFEEIDCAARLRDGARAPRRVSSLARFAVRAICALIRGFVAPLLLRGWRSIR